MMRVDAFSRKCWVHPSGRDDVAEQPVSENQGYRTSRRQKYVSKLMIHAHKILKKIDPNFHEGCQVFRV